MLGGIGAPAETEASKSASQSHCIPGNTWERSLSMLIISAIWFTLSRPYGSPSSTSQILAHNGAAGGTFHWLVYLAANSCLNSAPETHLAVRMRCLKRFLPLVDISSSTST